MTQRDKDLLLKDLCARLPYGVKICYIFNGEECVSTIEKIDAFGYIWDNYDGCYHVREIKPYLFSLSSMTEEQLKDLGTYYAKDSKNIVDDAIKYLESSLVMYKAAHVCFNTLEWYNKNHFDYRGLIEKGLAIDATGLKIY